MGTAAMSPGRSFLGNRHENQRGQGCHGPRAGTHSGHQVRQHGSDRRPLVQGTVVRTQPRSQPLGCVSRRPTCPVHSRSVPATPGTDAQTQRPRPGDSNTDPALPEGRASAGRPAALWPQHVLNRGDRCRGAEVPPRSWGPRGPSRSPPGSPASSGTSGLGGGPRRPGTARPAPRSRPDTDLASLVPGWALPVRAQHQGGGAGRPGALPAATCGARTVVVSFPRGTSTRRNATRPKRGLESSWQAGVSTETGAATSPTVWSRGTVPRDTQPLWTPHVSCTQQRPRRCWSSPVDRARGDPGSLARTRVLGRRRLGSNRQHQDPGGTPTLCPHTPQRTFTGSPTASPSRAGRAGPPDPEPTSPQGGLGRPGSGRGHSPACLWHQVVAHCVRECSHFRAHTAYQPPAEASSGAQGTVWHSDTVPGRNHLPATPRGGRRPCPTSHKRAGAQAVSPVTERPQGGRTVCQFKRLWAPWKTLIIK